MKMHMTAAGRDRVLQRLWVPFAVGKMSRIAGQTGVNRSALVAKARDVDIYGRVRTHRGNERKSDQDYGGPAHLGTAYQQPSGLAKCLIP